MNIHKVRIALDGRYLESFVREGVLATVEIGKQVEKRKTPEIRLSIITGLKGDQPVAWIQVAKPDQDGNLSITHEGWIGDGSSVLDSLKKDSSIEATIESAQEVPDKS